MRRSALVFAGLATVLISGCGSNEPSVEDRACNSIKNLTPGVLETQWDVKTLADPKSSQQDKLKAMRQQLDAKAGIVTYSPYQCSGPVWDRYLVEFQK